jgi:4-hydroxy-4-methyl-2-oxoglutarate aldolase
MDCVREDLSSDGASVAIDSVLLARAAKLSSATLHEAAKRRGALPSRIRPLHPAMRLCGLALPVRSPAGDNLWLHRALVEAQPGQVLVVDVGDGVEFGYWGEVMATAALARGLAGLVISGGVRDSLRLIELGLPTFSGCVSIRGTGKDPAGDGAVGAPIRLGEVVVRTGDLVFGDADGVVCLAPEVAAWAVPAGEQRDASEVEILGRIRQGATTLDVYQL